jgi:hypothetical protein
VSARFADGRACLIDSTLHHEGVGARPLGVRKVGEVVVGARASTARDRLWRDSRATLTHDTGECARAPGPPCSYRRPGSRWPGCNTEGSRSPRTRSEWDRARPRSRRGSGSRRTTRTCARPSAPLLRRPPLLNERRCRSIRPS